MASLLCGVDWVAQHVGTIEIANLSLGGGNLPSTCYSWDSLHNGFCHAVELGALFVVSAGNDGTDSVNSSPANYPEVVTVSALTDYDGLPGGVAPPPNQIPGTYLDDNKALFSNYGSVVDVIAPGVNILSTLPMNLVGYAHGTSMASPEATGVLAAYIAACGSEGALDAVLAYSTQGGWARVTGVWGGDVGPDHEPLIRFGSPCR
jgi:subtilisin family serine protease